MGFQRMVLLVPTMLGIVMDKDAAVPTTIEAFRTAVKALGRLVKEHVARGEDDLVRITMQILQKRTRETNVTMRF